MGRRLGVRLIVLGGILGAAWLAMAREGTRPAERTDVIAQLDFEPDAHLIAVPVVIEGASYPLAVDSGSALTIFDVSLRGHLGEQIGYANVLAGRQRVRLDRHPCPAAFVGGLALDAAAGVLCFDFEPFRSKGAAINGLIGVDFLRQHVVRIDFDAGTLQILSGLPANRGVRFPLDWTHGNPIVRAKVGHQDEWFIIDSGDDGSIALREELFDEAAISHKRDWGNITLAGVSRCSRGSLAEFRLGPFEHHNLPAQRFAWSAIGARYLSRYVVTLDLASNALFLRPGKRYDRVDLPL